MAHGKQHGGIGLYVAVALILGVITFVEFAIVEWPPTFMSSGWVLFWLIALSAVKFWMVIWFFMHLKDDDKLYTGFFSSGMVIAMGTFAALAFLFLLPRAVAPVVAAEASSELHADGGHGKST
ncbi:MAG: cytochrome C oxidase subunit IV family protein, partial [bacterium]|nr:cytochrome C oxidase subunit IV family protein [bacterium]